MSWRETKQIPAVYILEQSCKQPQASSTAANIKILIVMRCRQSVGHLWSGVLYWNSSKGHTVDVFLSSPLAASSTSSCQRSMGTEVWQTGEVSVSYYSLRNTFTFPFCGSVVMSAHPGYKRVQFTHKCWCEKRHSCPMDISSGLIISCHFFISTKGHPCWYQAPIKTVALTSSEAESRALRDHSVGVSNPVWEIQSGRNFSHVGLAANY